MESLFTRFEPSPRLMPYVQGYWRSLFNPEGLPDFEQVVLPNGCIELIVHLANNFCMLPHGSGWQKGPEFPLIGLFGKPYPVRFPAPVPVFGIRFYPDGIPNLFGVAPSAFMAQYGESADMLGGWLETFCARVRETALPAAQVEWANRSLEAMLEKNQKPFDYTHSAMQLIRKQGGVVDFEQLVKQVPVSLRQLQREFKSSYGLAITDYMRLARMNAIQRYMMAGKPNLTRLSYELDFADQSHFIREFRNFAGIPPGRYLRSREQFIANAG